MNKPIRTIQKELELVSRVKSGQSHRDFIQESEDHPHYEQLTEDEFILKVVDNKLFNQQLKRLRLSSLKEAVNVKLLLSEHKINIVTVESVTSGLIASTLTDVSAEGGVLYGSQVVYDTDAKRNWLDVKTPNLYNKETAKQMAEGILKNSRAMLAVSITGNATPFYDSVGCVGIADIAISLRLNNNKFQTKTARIDAKDDKYIRDKANQWIKDHKMDILPDDVSGYPNIYKTLKLNNLIRYKLVELTLNFLKNEIPRLNFNERGTLGDYLYRDIEYRGCGEPSWYIKHNLKNADGLSKYDRPEIKYKKSNSLCNENNEELPSHCKLSLTNTKNKNSLKPTVSRSITASRDSTLNTQVPRSLSVPSYKTTVAFGKRKSHKKKYHKKKYHKKKSHKKKSHKKK